MKRQSVREIKERDTVESVFLVRDKITAMARNGKPYLTLKLMDHSGEIEGRIWDQVDEFSARFERDDFVRVAGKASSYLGKMQLVIHELAPVPESEVDLAEFLPVSSRPAQEMRADLARRVMALANPHLRGLMEAFLADAEFMELFLRAPAAKTMHHVYLGGLLEHSLCVADLAEDVSRRYPELDRDLLVVGALLHDVGKIAELRYQRSFEYTDVGKLLGHIVMGVELVEEKLRQLPEFPPMTATLLKHLLLSHHGQYEYGSPKRPKTLEAVVLNFLDDLDSKINGIRTHLEREGDETSGWTSYHRFYERYFYRTPASMPQPVTPSPTPSPSREKAAPAAVRDPRSGRDHAKPLGYSLAEQLRGKSLELFSTDKED